MADETATPEPASTPQTPQTPHNPPTDTSVATPEPAATASGAVVAAPTAELPDPAPQPVPRSVPSSAGVRADDVWSTPGSAGSMATPAQGAPTFGTSAYEVGPEPLPPGAPGGDRYPGTPLAGGPYGTDPYGADPYGTDPSGAGAATPAPSRGTKPAAVLALAMVVALIAGLVGGAIGFVVSDRVSSDSVTDAGAVLSQAPAGDTSRPEGSVAGIAQEALPAVVSIAVRGATGRSTGSGFVIRQDGYVVTNNHVIEAAAQGGEIVVSFKDGSTAPGTIVGRDPEYDLAVLKVERTGLPILPLGNSDNVVVGDPVVAVGSPLGLSGTVTSGIVSALNRPVTAGGSGTGETSFINAIQTDAAINPGNSGGPLLNGGGQVIGVNSAIATLSGGESSATGSIGLGFSIPVNQVKTTAEQIIRTGRSTKPVIGVTLDLAYGGPGVRLRSTASGSGAGVVPGGPADQAGLRPGEVILEVDGRAVGGADEFIVALRSKQPGDTVTLTVQRGNDEVDVVVTLAGETSSA
jgi:putative serine protease PepD